MIKKRGGGKVSKSKKKSGLDWPVLVIVFLFLFSLISLLVGIFGFFIGKQTYSMFVWIMGSMAWAGLFLCLVFSILFKIYSSKLKSMATTSSGTLSTEISSPAEQDLISKGISLPAGKLVSLKGFNKYFSSPEWVEIEDNDTQRMEDMAEIGQDFPSYFRKGESYYPNKPRKMTTLKGLEDYFVQVDYEERQDGFKLTDIPETENPELCSSVFKSQKDQEEFLSQFKEDGNPIDHETLDYLGDLRESSRTIEEAEKIAQVVELSISKIGLDNKIQSILMPETKVMSEGRSETGTEEKFDPNFIEELTNETALAAEGIDELPETVCTHMEMLEAEATVAAASVLIPNYAGQVAPLVNSTVERVNEWKLPLLDLLDSAPHREIMQDEETPKLLEKVLLDFGVKAKVIRVARGPVITRYELAPAPGVKISKIVNLADDIALGLAARDVRIEAPIPGKAAIGIEVPNKHPRAVPFREVLETTSFGQYPSKLKVALGKDIADQPIIADLIKMPHLLVAGATGSGKSVCITTIINSILFNATPHEVKFLLVDPKMVELSQYNGIPHLLAPVVVDPKKAASALKWIVKEMENRYALFAAAGVRDIERYNKLKSGETMSTTPALPFIVVIIDELADLMMVAAGEVEEAVCRLAQMARAAGIHLVIATQRPSVDVITGVIKANIPSRISFAVSSQIDSRTILDATGAEKLLGRGDMLYSPLGVNKALRVQGCLVTDDEVQRVIMHWKGLGRPEYLDPERLFEETTIKNEESNGPDDALFIDAGQLVIRTGMGSVSFLQRRLKLGYARAARLMDMLEEQGVVGSYEGSKPRIVLITIEEFNERFG
jgi:S-DNA-T family DNA segregation ATPase FtsK/SpoIIIE